MHAYDAYDGNPEKDPKAFPTRRSKHSCQCHMTRSLERSAEL